MMHSVVLQIALLCQVTPPGQMPNSGSIKKVITIGVDVVEQRQVHCQKYMAKCYLTKHRSVDSGDKLLECVRDRPLKEDK